jgi:predicted AAA+ superfamily ATPase
VREARGPGLQFLRSRLTICAVWIDREIEELLLRRARERPVVVLTGARQTGKTSLVRRLFPGHEFVSLDLPSEAEQAERDPGAFLSRHPPPLVVDEIQYAPRLFRRLKIEVDRHRDTTGQFILTGSQHFTLMRAASESLAGRAEIMELEGLSWREIRAGRPAMRVEEIRSFAVFLHPPPAARSLRVAPPAPASANRRGAVRG